MGLTEKRKKYAWCEDFEWKILIFDNYILKLGFVKFECLFNLNMDLILIKYLWFFGILTFSNQSKVSKIKEHKQ